MSSFVLGAVSPQNLMNWIKVNDATSLKGTVGDSWRAYLSSHGGTGSTFYDLETSYLRNLGITVGTLQDRWNTQIVSAGKNGHEKARNYFK
jgi:hypothetical protein